MKRSRAAIEAGFALIERAALAGERCPTTLTTDNPTGTLLAGIAAILVKEGRIKIEIYGRNWRVVEILKGPNAGKRTKEAPGFPRVWPYRRLP
jgi:hypothetical protein